MGYKGTALAGLALAGLLAVNMSFGDEIVVTETTEATARIAGQANRNLLEKANAAAVEKAIEAVLADTKLDLDIRLIGPTSIKIAGDR